MASNKTGITNMQAKGGASLVAALLKILAFGITGGAALLGGAKALGDQLEKKQVRDYEKREAQREADKENVRRIMENSVETEYQSDDNTSDR